MIKKRFKNILIRSLFILIGISGDVAARSDAIQEGALIRDQEIEGILEDFMAPLLKAADVSPGQAKIYIVADPEINASAGMGGTLLIHTGLILSCDNAEQLIGVLAHELGHIAGGHVSRTIGVNQKAGMRAMIASMIGAVAMIAAGSPEGATGAMALGQTVHMHSMLHYSRGQEGAADQAAAKILATAHLPVKGLHDFLEKLQKKEYLSSAMQDPYMRTHPFSSDRMALLKNAMDEKVKMPASLEAKFQLIKMKTKAFFERRDVLLREHRGRSFQDRYVRAVVSHRQGKTAEAHEMVVGLLREKPHDGGLWDLSGQFLSERGQWKQAQQAYEKAKKYGLKGSLVDVAHAQTIISGPSPSRADLEKAVVMVKKAIHRDHEVPLGWRLLAISYGKMGRMGDMALALAESSLQQGDTGTAKHQAKKAQSLLKKGSPAWIKAEDILSMDKKPPHA
ncbi:M48 family metalloprotease [Alphaproteobacteria bacterium]|nr:M48 family metalloprotease [Alphaproteobacteria bacterium]